MNAEDSLRQAVILSKSVLDRLKMGTLRLSEPEAASIDVLLQELVLQAAAIGGRIHEQQTWQKPWGYSRF
jgi:hypothetical protein